MLRVIYAGEVSRIVPLLCGWIAHVSQRFRRECGQTLPEYSVVLAVITLIVVGALEELSGSISSTIDEVINFL